MQTYCCRACDYDICPSCVAGPPCPGNHSLEIHNVGAGWCCDGCKSSFESFLPSHGCRICNYDLCDACYSKGKSKVHAEIAETEPHHLDYDPVHIPQTGGRTRCLFVGINYPGTSAELKGCVNDVRVMLQLLEDNGVNTSDRRILVDEHGFPGRNGSPTRAEIVKGLSWLVEGAKAGDVLFFHYSGHGTSVRDNDGDEDDGCDEALVPGDYQSAGMLRDDDIFNLVLRNLPAGVRLTCITDCCHSGTIMDLEHQYKCKPPRGWNGRPAGYYHQSHEPYGTSHESTKFCAADVIQFSGCKDDQTSADTHTSAFENPYDGPGFAGGACTNAITELLTKYPTISYSQLLCRMQELLQEKGYSQIPQLSVSRKFSLDSKFSFTEPLPNE